MRISVFTSNQPRHLALCEILSRVADSLYAIHESNTVFPGKVSDFFNKSKVMQEYFSHVIAAERKVFGEIRFLPANVYQLPIRMGDLSLLDPALLQSALDADLIVVFGSSYIRGELIDKLVERRAINIHMGVSPYYRGSSCNFWALYDGSPDLVGSTIHLLSRSLDSGDILFHALPAGGEIDPFVLGMKAVNAAHQSLARTIADGSVFTMEPVRQDKKREIRYSRGAEFTDSVASEYLRNLPTKRDVAVATSNRQMGTFERPLVI